MPSRKGPLMGHRGGWGRRVSCHHWNWSPRLPSARGSCPDILLSNLQRLVSSHPNSFLFNRDNFIALTDKNHPTDRLRRPLKQRVIQCSTTPTSWTIGIVQCLRPQGTIGVAQCHPSRAQLEWPLWGPGACLGCHFHCQFHFYNLSATRKETMSESNLEEQLVLCPRSGPLCPSACSPSFPITNTTPTPF